MLHTVALAASCSNCFMSLRRQVRLRASCTDVLAAKLAAITCNIGYTYLHIDAILSWSHSSNGAINLPATCSTAATLARCQFRFQFLFLFLLLFFGLALFSFSWFSTVLVAPAMPCCAMPGRPDNVCSVSRHGNGHQGKDICRLDLSEKLQSAAWFATLIVQSEKREILYK